MTQQPGSVAVVGGGPAGLAAAWRLVSSGCRVRVYESRTEVGGGLRTEEIAGVAADPVVQLISEGYTELRSLLERMGCADRLVEVPGEDALWRRGSIHPLQYGSVARMALSAALPGRLKLRLGLKYMPFLERHASNLDLNQPAIATAAGLDDETIAEWGQRELGEDFVELLAYPLLAAYYGVLPEETGAGLFHALAHAGTRVRLFGVRGGGGRLGSDMAAALRERGVDLALHTRVDRVALDGDEVHIQCDGDSFRHQAVVVALPPAAAAGVTDAAWLGEVPGRSTATLILATRSPIRTGWFGLSIPRTAPPGDRIAAVAVQAEKRTGVVRDGGSRADAGSAAAAGSLVVVPTPAEGEQWAEWEPGRVLERALPAVERVLPDVAGDVVEARVVRLPGAVTLPLPGHYRRMAGRAEQSSTPRIALAGGYLVAPTVEGAVRSGLTAAQRLVAAGTAV